MKTEWNVVKGKKKYFEKEWKYEKKLKNECNYEKARNNEKKNEK